MARFATRPCFDRYGRSSVSAVEVELERLREVRSPTELARLAATVRTHASMLDEESLTAPHIDHRLAQAAADVLCDLIDMSSELDIEQRSWLVAAARYFILTDDEASDLGIDGLHDDVEAIMLVCQKIGHPELGMRLSGWRS